ncbi:phage tail protein [Nostoc sp. CHAB 5784]|uniref:phage tail protein n=1 Tax=Nostoc mirabile TaxID=2907820 RepID=UPI001E3CADDE|nr:phage tail protein [Nostoc mirabile]MCC5666861.1 phage tail protein [Nostoc mirabile CHAB5784]
MPANSKSEKNGNNIRELSYVTANRFYVEIESSITACFTECSGLGVDLEYKTQYEGGVNDQQRVFLGQAKFSPVTLKRGITNDLVFWYWLEQILTQKDPSCNNASSTKNRRNVNILLFNQAGETMQRWTLIGAVPVGWKAPSLNADSSTVAIEELTLIYEGLKVSNQQSNSSGSGASILKDGRHKKGYFNSY